jgi:signal transduction histidine kinase
LIPVVGRLRVRLAFRAAVLSLVAMAGVVWGVDLALVRSLSKRADESLRTLADGLAAVAEEGGGGAFRAEARSWLRVDAGQFAALMAPDGRLLGLEGASDGAVLPSGRSAGSPGVDKRGVQTVAGLRPAGHRVAWTVLADGGRVLVGQRLDEVEAEQGRLRWILLGIGGLGVVLVSMGAWFGAGFVLDPLRGITEAARRSRAEGETAVLPVRGRGDEFDDLAALLNDLFARLGATLEEERRFASEAAHELRAPLALLRLRADGALLSDDGAGNREALEAIVEDCDRISRLVQALLELSRVEANPEALQARCDGGAVLEEILPDFGALAEARGRRFLGDEGGFRGVILAAPREILETGMSVLIDNALRYSPPGGLVRVETEIDSSGFALVRVRDEGAGVAAEEASRVFDRLYRGQAGREAGGGFGLGLSLARRLARSCGGDVRLMGSQGGAGAVFELLLPLAVS